MMAYLLEAVVEVAEAGVSTQWLERERERESGLPLDSIEQLCS